MKKDGWFFDNNFNGVPDDVLDNVGEFFNFQLEDVEAGDVMEEDWNAQFNNLEEPSLGLFPISATELTRNENPKLGGNFPLSVAKTDGPTFGKTIPIKNVYLKGTDFYQFKTCSPVSVFDVPVIPAKRPRGKRRRRSNFSKLISSIERQPAGKPSRRFERKQMKMDIKMKKSSSLELVVSKKCTHCEMTETPQWRLGPMGPKTLCNACGVRYRSGRLFPEYRPAASPTFVASLHSNSHKKVLEMRNKANWEIIEGSSVDSLSKHPGNSLV